MNYQSKSYIFVKKYQGKYFESISNFAHLLIRGLIRGLKTDKQYFDILTQEFCRVTNFDEENVLNFVFTKKLFKYALLCRKNSLSNISFTEKHKKSHFLKKIREINQNQIFHEKVNFTEFSRFGKMAIYKYCTSN